MNSNRSPRLTKHTSRTLAATAAAGALAMLLSGCGMSSSLGKTAAPGTAASAAIHLSGNVHGGQQPVSGSTIQLYAVGTTGLRSASTALIGSTVTTDASGNWNVTGLYTCPSGTSQVYVTATGGNPGGGTNSAISLVAALGSCGSLTASTFVVINEVTTVAAAYALAPFAADLAHVGASGATSPGMQAAFGNSAVLANFAAGMSPGANLGTGVTVPNAEINTLADILASCVNTTGASSSQCMQLFSATGATDTFGAALAIAKNPGTPAITALYTLAAPTSPFQPTMNSSSAPNDFTVAVTSTGGGTLATPFGIAIDAAGYAYVANESGTTVTQLNNTSPALLATITATGLAGAQGVAVDRNANLWIANTAGNSVVKVAVSGTTIGTPVSYTANIAGPTAVALDSSSNAWISNFNGNSVAELTSTGAAAAGSPFTGNGNITLPQAVAIGPAGNVYATSSTGAVVKLSNAGVFVQNLADGTLQAPAGVAVDPSGHVLATGFTTGSAVGGGLSQFSSAGAPVSGSPATAGINTPQGIATDGTSTWIANAVPGGGLAQYTYGSAVPMSPTAGYGSLNVPVGVAVDASGCVWVTNSGNNTVSKFIGLSTPIATPIAVNVGP